MDVQELACWLWLVFESKLSLRTVNGVLLVWCKQLGRTLREFFAADVGEWDATCHLHAASIEKLVATKERLPVQEVVVTKLERDGIQAITVLDEAYPTLMKAALNRSHIPPLLFYIGDLQLLNRQTIAIIGSRNASETSIDFTSKAARYLAEHEANIISGNARGVDRAAYEGATGAEGGHTTLVLPHGVRKLSRVQIENIRKRSDQVLVVSQFHPDAPWLVSRAMERNTVVTSLAQIVIVAEADSKGGTWEGANGALKQGRRVYARTISEDSALPGNQFLLEKGAQALAWPVDDIATVLAPVLQESSEVRQQHNEVEVPPDQFSLLATSESKSHV